MANNNHVTKSDLNALGGELKGDMKGLRDELKADMTALRDELKADHEALRNEMRGFRDELAEMIRDVETKLLKVFYGFAESTQQRLAQHDGFNGRLAIIERRLTDLEKRVNFPHAP